MTVNHSEREASTCSERQARENACEQVLVGLSLNTDCLRKWRKFFKGIYSTKLNFGVLPLVEIEHVTR